MPKAPGEKPGVLERGHWSRYAGTGWKTVTYGRFQPVLKAGFPEVYLTFILQTLIFPTPSSVLRSYLRRLMTFRVACRSQSNLG